MELLMTSLVSNVMMETTCLVMVAALSARMSVVMDKKVHEKSVTMAQQTTTLQLMHADPTANFQDVVMEL